ncbi:MAG: hypothetical protein JRN67_09055 [Nitrososphaerota archaeon]|nr:hypothetical protein [Nitrososphaerota archaeon]MDG7000587.1 hypothetical protein [Nitrososphaerota archaeon]
MSLEDATIQLQEAISNACSMKQGLRLQKGDYAIASITVPKNCDLTIYSKDRVRILYIGKRNRPMFILGDNSHLHLEEKLELYYNTNNIQEVSALMVKKPPTASFQVSGTVKISLFSLKQ